MNLRTHLSAIAATLVALSALAGCEPNTAPTARVASESLAELPEYLRWWTLVFEDARLSRRDVRRYERALRDAGADRVVFLEEIGVAFARFDESSSPEELEGIVGVFAADPAATYTLAGLPSLEDMRSGNVDLEEFEARRASRRPHRGPARPRGVRAPTEDDHLYEADWGLHRIHAPQAWSRTTGSHRTVVAVIDTGVANNHPDLDRNVVHSACFHFSSITSGEPCNPYPMFQHGTHVAGTIAAQFGGGEAVGVGPNLGIASYNVFEPLALRDYDLDGDGDSGTIYYPLATDVQILSALIDAAQRGYEVVNMSLGAILPSDLAYVNASVTAWQRAVDYANRRGTTIVVAAGNEGDYVDAEGNVIGDLDGDAYVIVPAELEGVVTVGATGFRLDDEGTPRDIQAYYSNYGARVDVSAPGGDMSGDHDPDTYSIVSTEMMVDSLDDSIMAELLDIPFEENACLATGTCEVGYLAFQGTSMASPHVAGTVGLLYERCRRRGGYEEVLRRLVRTAQPGPEGFPMGAGIVDVAAAVR